MRLQKTFCFLLALAAFTFMNAVQGSAQTTSPAFLSAQPPQVITDEYIAAHFYERPPAVKFNAKDYGLDGRKLYVSALRGSDSNPGTGKAPFFTIQKAVDVSAPGDIIYVMKGTYTGNKNDNVVTFYNKHGTKKHWIMLRNYPGHNPLLQIRGWSGISIQGSSYIIVSGFIVRGQADTVSYKYAYKNRKNGSNPVTCASGIVVMFLYDNYTVRSHNITVADNIVYNCPAMGINSLLADYLGFFNNISCYNGKWAPYGSSGISVYQNQAVDNSRDIKVIISGNISYCNENRIPFIHVGKITDGNGIIVDDIKHTQSWEPYTTKDRYFGKTLVQNNICFYNGGQGINVFESEFVTVRNNTCFHNARTGQIKGGEIWIGNSSKITVTANIAVSTNKNGDKAFMSFGSRAVNMADNLFYGRVDSPGPGKRALLNKNPQFINTSADPAIADFRLQKGSPAIDYAAGGAQTDIQGTPRPQGKNVEPGAYEFVP